MKVKTQIVKRALLKGLQLDKALEASHPKQAAPDQQDDDDGFQSDDGSNESNDSDYEVFKIMPFKSILILTLLFTACMASCFGR